LRKSQAAPIVYLNSRFNLAGFAVWLFSSLCLFASLVILNGAETIKAFQPDQLQALAVFFVSLYRNGVFMAQVPYGVWLFPLGYLVLKSRFLPKILVRQWHIRHCLLQI
jgi:hypothetical protein